MTWQEELHARREKAWQRLCDTSADVWATALAEIADCSRDSARAVVLEAEPTPAVDAVCKWLRSGCARHLVLRGGIGVGKTFAALMAVRQWARPVYAWSHEFEQVREIRPSTRVVWLRPDTLTTAMRFAWRDDARELAEKLSRAHRVVIDDLGTETRDVSQELCELLDTGNRRLLITTNLTREQMRERYDARVLDRLNHLGFAVDVRGPSRRRRDGGF